jgi:citrate/tricarballylate utilization protein
MSSAETSLAQLVAEAQRVLSICNACRYCEGYCAVFPALERRLEFTEHDVHYLANLCHNCGACLYACQYAPPHEFQLNFPRTLAQVRAHTYKKYAWPRFLAGLFERNGVAVSLITAASPALVLFLTAVFVDPTRLYAEHPASAGGFYAVIPHNVMAIAFGAVALLVLIAFVVSVARFWSDMRADAGGSVPAGSFARATWDALRLRYLDGGGDGCTYPAETPSFARRRFHHLTFYGFTLCFAATCVAAIYHYIFGWKAPYEIWSAPVLLGTIGGVGLLIGPVGLLWLKKKRDPELADTKQTGMDVAFLVLLFLTSLTGLLLLGLRETSALGILLAAHLGVVLALFVTLPYGKFVHALYRFAALMRHHAEKRRPQSESNSE